MDGKRQILPTDLVYEFAGVKMNYRILGQGKPVILLHGSLISDPWNGFEKLLAQKYKVYLPELPGFGASQAVPGRIHNTDLFTEAISEFIRVLGLEKVPLVAFSVGAEVAVKVAAQRSYKSRLILVGMPVRWESPLMERIMELPLPARHALAANEIARGGLLWAILTDIIGKIDLKMADKYLKMLKTTDVRAMVDINPVEEIEKDLPWVLSQVKNQMYFVYGEKDKLRIGAQGRLGRKVRIVKNAGHDVFSDQPKETLKLMEKLLFYPNIFLRFC